MMNFSDLLIAGVVIGIGATLVMDLWALMLQRVFQVKSLSFCLVGRWFSHILQGRFTHNNIVAAAPHPAECALGWTAHYLIGIAYALVLPAGGQWLLELSLWPTLLLGLVTLVFPFLVMQPALGFGVMASKTPNPAQARLKTLVTHTVFGVGLYLSALLFHVVVIAW